MDVVYDLLVVAHLLGMAAIIGGWFATFRDPKVLPVMVVGALTQLVTGIALVGLAESGAVDTELDRAKIAVKLVIALVVTVLAVANRGRASVSTGIHHGIGGLAVVNVLVAVLW